MISDFLKNVAFDAHYSDPESVKLSPDTQVKNVIILLQKEWSCVKKCDYSNQGGLKMFMKNVIILIQNVWNCLRKVWCKFLSLWLFIEPLCNPIQLWEIILLWLTDHSIWNFLGIFWWNMAWTHHIHGTKVQLVREYDSH